MNVSFAFFKWEQHFTFFFQNIKRIRFFQCATASFEMFLNGNHNESWMKKFLFVSACDWNAVA